MVSRPARSCSTHRNAARAASGVAPGSHGRRKVTAAQKGARNWGPPFRRRLPSPRVPHTSSLAIVVLPIIVLVPIIGPGSPIARGHAVDIARYRTISDEQPRTVVASRAIPVTVEVHVPAVAITIDVVVRVAHVVDPACTRHGTDPRLAIEAELWAVVAVADPERERGSGIAAAIRCVVAVAGGAPVIVLVPVVAPAMAIPRRHRIDVARNRAVPDEDPGTAIAARAVPVSIVVHIPIVAVAIDVVVGVLNVVHAPSRNADQVRHFVEAEVRTTIAIADAKHEAAAHVSVADAVVVTPGVVAVAIVSPRSTVLRRDCIDVARNRAVSDEDPGTAIAARAVPITVVV